jgi:hypothetical protein
MVGVALVGAVLGIPVGRIVGSSVGTSPSGVGGIGVGGIKTDGGKVGTAVGAAVAMHTFGGVHSEMTCCRVSVESTREFRNAAMTSSLRRCVVFARLLLTVVFAPLLCEAVVESPRTTAPVSELLLLRSTKPSRHAQ